MIIPKKRKEISTVQPRRPYYSIRQWFIFLSMMMMMMRRPKSGNSNCVTRYMNIAVISILPAVMDISYYYYYYHILNSDLFDEWLLSFFSAFHAWWFESGKLVEEFVVRPVASDSMTFVENPKPLYIVSYVIFLKLFTRIGFQFSILIMIFVQKNYNSSNTFWKCFKNSKNVQYKIFWKSLKQCTIKVKILKIWKVLIAEF